jgi:hypothetical protein
MLVRVDITTGRDGIDEEETKREQQRVRRLKERRAADNEVPVSVAFDSVLAATDDLAVFVSGLRVFSNGVDFTVEVRARRRTGGGRRTLSDALHGNGDTQLLLGVEFSDGRRCSNVGLRLMEAADAEPTLWPGGGGSGGRGGRISLFLSPLPPPGELRMICAWPSQGIEDSAVLLPTNQILEAAGRVTELWAWEPEEHEHEPRSLPEVPDDSWFAADLR